MYWKDHLFPEQTGIYAMFSSFKEEFFFFKEKLIAIKNNQNINKNYLATTIPLKIIEKKKRKIFKKSPDGHCILGASFSVS